MSSFRNRAALGAPVSDRRVEFRSTATWSRYAPVRDRRSRDAYSFYGSTVNDRELVVEAAPCLTVTFIS